MQVFQNNPKMFEGAASCARFLQEDLIIKTNSASANVVPPELKYVMEYQQSSMDQLTKIIATMQMEKYEVCVMTGQTDNNMPTM